MLEGINLIVKLCKNNPYTLKKFKYSKGSKIVFLCQIQYINFEHSVQTLVTMAERCFYLLLDLEILDTPREILIKCHSCHSVVVTAVGCWPDVFFLNFKICPTTSSHSVCDVQPQLSSKVSKKQQPECFYHNVGGLPDVTPYPFPMLAPYHLFKTECILNKRFLFSWRVTHVIPVIWYLVPNSDNLSSILSL